MMERCPGQAGVERTLRGNEEIDPQMAKARLVVIGLDEGSCAASRHPLSCMPAGSNPQSEGPRCRPEMCRPQGSSTEPSLTMQIPETSRVTGYFFAIGDRRGPGAALPRAIRR